MALSQDGGRWRLAPGDVEAPGALDRAPIRGDKSAPSSAPFSAGQSSFAYLSIGPASSASRTVSLSRDCHRASFKAIANFSSLALGSSAAHAKWPL